MLATASSRNDYVGAGNVGPFPYGFKIWAASDLRVVKRSALGVETVLNYPTDFSVTGIGKSAGGNVTLTTALAVGENIVIRRVRPLTQTTDLRNQSTYFREDTEDALDKSVMNDQQLQDSVSRAFSLPESINPAGFGLTVTPEVGKVLAWQSANQLGNSRIDTTGIVLPGEARTVATASAYLMNNRVVNVKDYGALGDGIANDTAAIQAAITEAQLLITMGVIVGCIIRIPFGKYLITNTLNITSHRIHILGDGIYATDMIFNPAAAAALFKFQAANPTQVIYQCSLRQLSCTGVGAQQKIAFDVWDCSEFTIEETTTNSWTGNSGNAATPSIALRSNGREILTVRKVDWFADRPIHFRVNPNSTATEAMDHFHLTDIYTAAQVATEANILIDANIATGNVTFDGYLALIGGTYGILYQSGGTSGAAGIIASIKGLRYEQCADAVNGWAVRWEGQSTQNLAFYDSFFGGANNGTYMRNVQRLTYVNCTYAGGSPRTAHDWTTCDQVWLFNTFSQVGSAIVLGTLEEMWSTPFAAATPHPETIHYVRPDLHAIRSIKIGGVHKYSYKALINAGAFLNLPLLTIGNGLKAATIHVAGYSATGPINEGGTALGFANAAVLVGGTANFAVGNIGGKLCVFFNGGNPMVLLNNTAQALQCVIDITATY
jgi:hypothetical protein